MPTPPATTPFDLALHGTLNGALVTLDLDGVISPGELRFDLRPASPAPLVGDLTVLALAAIDVPLLVACGAAQLEEDGPRCSWVDVAARGEAGVLVGRLELAVEAEFAGGKLGIRAQLMRGEGDAGSRRAGDAGRGAGGTGPRCHRLRASGRRESAQGEKPRIGIGDSPL